MAYHPQDRAPRRRAAAVSSAAGVTTIARTLLSLGILHSTWVG